MKILPHNTIINMPYLTSSNSTTFPLSHRTIFLLLLAHHTFPHTLLIFCVLALFTMAMSTMVPSITSSIFLPFKSLAKIIRRVRGKVWWAKRRRKIVRRDNGKVVEFEEVKYGMLMMGLCDREGRVYDVWITFGSMHEVRAFRQKMCSCV